MYEAVFESIILQIFIFHRQDKTHITIHLVKKSEERLTFEATKPLKIGSPRIAKIPHFYLKFGESAFNTRWLIVKLIQTTRSVNLNKHIHEMGAKALIIRHQMKYIKVVKMSKFDKKTKINSKY